MTCLRSVVPLWSWELGVVLDERQYFFQVNEVITKFPSV
jgi:hypothetical protein